jgi:hypothetical protein
VVVVVAEVAPTPVDSWAQRVYPFKYLKCPVCQVPARKWCVSRSGRIVGGRPDEVEQRLDRPHTQRKISKARMPR